MQRKKISDSSIEAKYRKDAKVTTIGTFRFNSLLQYRY